VSPAYVSGVLGRVFAVRWVRFTLATLSVVREEIATARRVTGRRLVYLSLIPATPRSFTDMERDALRGYLRDLLKHDCVSIHHVIAGTGFAASARRSIVTNLALAAARPDVFHTYATLEEALGEIAVEVGEAAGELLAEARRLDLELPAA